MIKLPISVGRVAGRWVRRLHGHLDHYGAALLGRRGRSGHLGRVGDGEGDWAAADGVECACGQREGTD